MNLPRSECRESFKKRSGDNRKEKDATERSGILDRSLRRKTETFSEAGREVKPHTTISADADVGINSVQSLGNNSFHYGGLSNSKMNPILTMMTDSITKI